MKEETKKQVLDWFPYGLYAIGVRREEERNAFTANWVSQVSFEPPMVAVAVENDGKSIGMMRESGVFSVNVYNADQRREAGRLARPAARAPEKLGEMHYEDGETGVPLLTDALGGVECKITNEVEAGDHTVIIGEVVQASVFHEGEPLTIRSAGFSYSG